MDDKRRSVALTIKARLKSLMTDAERCDLGDLARFIELAALAADDAAGPVDPRHVAGSAFTSSEYGHC